MRTNQNLLTSIAEETQHNGDHSPVDFNDNDNSRQRIEAVKDWFSENNHGFSKEEGESYPATSGDTDEGRAMRRIREFKTAYQLHADLAPHFLRSLLT